MKVAERARMIDRPTSGSLPSRARREGNMSLPITTTLSREDWDRFLDDYYDERGCDRESGAPLPEKLMELGP